MWLFNQIRTKAPSIEDAYDICLLLSEQIKATASSKAKGKVDTFIQSFSKILGNGVFDSTLATEENIKLWSRITKKTSFLLSPGNLIFVAKSRNGYKNLLRLISISSVKKHDYIKGISGDANCIINFSDIKKYSEDVTCIDCVDDSSVLGILNYFDNMQSPLALCDKWGVKDWPIDAYGIGTNISDNTISIINDVISDPRRRCVAFPKSHYANASEYEAYVVKYAVHNDKLINDIDFFPPEKNTFIRQRHSVEKKYIDIANKIPSFSHTHWDAFPSADVELNQIKLPNYNMSVKEVVEYALKLNGEEFESFLGEEDALTRFDTWIKSSAPENLPFCDFRQKRLNDFCLHKLSYEGMLVRLNEEFGEDADENFQVYQKRHAHEFKVIERMGFAGYFLIVYDIVSWARSKGVPVGDGRGSAAGSLICYCLEVTDVDPILYDLQFERFLNPERVSMPDIDVDFGQGEIYDRGDVLKYVSEMYQQEGADFPSSCQIANINRYQLKSSIAVVRKAYGLSMRFDIYLKFLIKGAEQELGISEPKSINWDDLLGLDKIQVLMSQNPMLKKVLEMARFLTGKMSTYGVHAGGVVISPSVIPDYAAISCDSEGNYFSQLDKDDIETAGLIKFDFLGLKTLSVISEAISQIEKNRQIKIDPRKIDKHDPKVYELICSQVLSDVFQLESNGMRDLVGNLQPQNIGEIAVLSALYRPGALDSGMVEEYIDVKFGKSLPTYDHPALETVTRETFGCIVFQEQVMSIVRELAGYSLGEADLLRRAMGKKKIEEMHKQRAIYGYRAQQRWSDSYVEIGKKMSFKFILNINLKDLQPELEHLGVWEFVDEHGHLASETAIYGFMGKMLSQRPEDVELLKSRVSDFKYTVQLFKNHYQSALDLSFKGALHSYSTPDKLDEVSKRVYYAVTQFVRFNQIFNKVEKFAGYGFNKSHAIAYSVISYITAYLKTHYPAEFYSAALSFKDLDKLHPTVVEATQKMGVKLLPPNVNKSNVRFSVEGNTSVRYGLGKLRGVSKKATVIVSERADEGPYLGIYNFLHRLSSKQGKPDSTSITSLSVTGAFDEFIPKRIARNKLLNGRQYIIWISSLIIKSKFYKDKVDDTSIHILIDTMSDYEFSVYLSLLAGVNVIQKDKMLQLPEMNAFLDWPEESDTFDVRSKIKLLKLKQKMTSVSFNENIRSVMSRWGADELVDYPRIISLVKDTVAGRLVGDFLQDPKSLNEFEKLYIQWFDVFFDDHQLYENWNKAMEADLNVPVTETLNAERHASGMYMTSTPIKVLNIAERVEREPPSSVIDGCPVPIKVIDNSYDEQPVTTYGIVRDVNVKTVKKETSKWFNEKMLFFTLEHGADTISCMIFGNKPTSEFHNKIINDGSVILAAGSISNNDFGLTLKVEAVKRYYPVEDEKLQIVPSMNR
jgi:DNA-directed DNA polymerase III PolC